jgi:hypothetical protein
MPRSNRQNEIIMTIHIHYALQMSDVLFYQNNTRFCGQDRTLLSKKSLTSLIDSIQHCQKTRPETAHHLMIIEDQATEQLIEYTNRLIDKVQNPNITIKLHSLKPKTGMVDSLRYCYNWLDNNGQDFVFQVQDDYLFSINTIHDSIEHFYNILHNCNTHAIIQPFNDIVYWEFIYKNRPTPRLISMGKTGYWIQIYDTSCSFLTSHQQFSQHWDLYNKFFDLIPRLNDPSRELENKSLNYMFTQKGVLGVTPVNTFSHHIQQHPDPYVDWKVLWDSIDINP